MKSLLIDVKKINCNLNVPCQCGIRQYASYPLKSVFDGKEALEMRDSTNKRVCKKILSFKRFKKLYNASLPSNRNTS